MKRTLLVLSTLLSSITFSQDCADLFISEYVEGWSNNKAIELYNPTNASIDLSQYMIIRFANGAASATPANAVQLTGTLAPFDVHVGVLEKLDPLGTGQEAPIWDSLQARADAYYCPDYNISNAFYWNGNDAIALAKGTIGDIPNSILIDVFGKIGEDPGVAWSSDFPYTGAGVDVTIDHSMIRKSTILKGETNPTISYFDPLLEYDSIPAIVEIATLTYGNWFTLGSHTCDCSWLSVDPVEKSNIEIFPNPSNGEFHINGAENFSSIVVVNSLGQVVKSVKNNSKAIVSFDLDAKRGVYFVELRDNSGGTTTKRVIIK